MLLRVIAVELPASAEIPTIRESVKVTVMPSGILTTVLFPGITPPVHVVVAFQFPDCAAVIEVVVAIDVYATAPMSVPSEPVL